MYPNQDGNRFDITTTAPSTCPGYLNCLDPLSAAWRSKKVSRVWTPGSPAPYLAMGHLYFDSVAAFQDTFMPHVAPLLADIPNFTNCHPTV